MHPNLVCSPRSQLCVDQTIAIEATLRTHNRMSNLAFGLDFNATLTALGRPFNQRQSDMLARIDPIALNQS